MSSSSKECCKPSPSASPLSKVLKNLIQEYASFKQHARTTLETMVINNNERNFNLLKNILQFLQDMDRNYIPEHTELSEDSEDSVNKYWDEQTLPSIWEEVPIHLNPRNILFYVKMYVDDEDSEEEGGGETDISQ